MHQPPLHVLDAFANAPPERRDERATEFLGVTASRGRIRAAFAALIAVTIILTVRAGAVQLVAGTVFRGAAERNRTRTHIVVPTRGLITDRNGIPLVRNVRTYALGVIPADLPHDERRSDTIVTIARAVDRTPEDVVQLIASYGTQLTEPVALRDADSYDDAIARALSGGDALRIIVREQRDYRAGPDGLELLTHALGHLTRINPEIYRARSRDRYRPDDRIGATGIEAAYERDLRGTPGVQTVAVDAYGRIVTATSAEPPQPGRPLALTISRPIQAATERVLAAGIRRAGARAGAAILLNPNTGELLAIASAPSFSPTALVRGMTPAAYAALTENPARPLFPRAVAGRYPAGSTVKPFIAAYALSSGAIDARTRIRSTGGIRIGNSFLADWKPSGHGTVDVARAIAESVNTFFYYVGGGAPPVGVGSRDSPALRSLSGVGGVGGVLQPLGPDGLAAALRTFGFGSATGVDLPDEAAGFIPTPAWKQEQRREPWYIGDTYHLAIGQGDLLITPLQLAVATAAFANGGKRVIPRLVEERGAARPAELQRSRGSREQGIGRRIADITDEAITVVRQGMRMAVTSGSAQGLADLPFFVAGKTGTAQHALGKRPHAWFTGFAEVPDRPGVRCQVHAPRSLGEVGSGVRCRSVVVTVLVEEGGEGTAVAVPIARDLLLAWYGISD